MTILFIVVIVFVAALGFVVAFGAPYVPSKRSDLKVAFDELYPLSSLDLLVDIGSGDGVVVREASKRGAKAVGYEINPLLVLISRFFSRGDSNVKIIQANLWKVQFPPETTVVYVFGESRDINRMANKVQIEATRLGRALHLISYGFELKSQKPVKKAGAHFLYVISPLQAE